MRNVYFEHELKVAQGNNHADAISLSHVNF